MTTFYVLDFDVIYNKWINNYNAIFTHISS